MREIRQSGSEGGEPQPNAASLPLSGLRWNSSIDVASGSSTIWRLMATGIAVEALGKRLRQIFVVHTARFAANKPVFPKVRIATPKPLPEIGLPKQKLRITRN